MSRMTSRFLGRRVYDWWWCRSGKSGRCGLMRSASPIDSDDLMTQGLQIWGGPRPP